MPAKLSHILLLLLLSVAGQAQWALQPVRHPEAAVPTTAVALTLPFWEDFSTSGTYPDSLKWETGSHVFINSTLAQNAPTYKIATFDGLQASGKAHAIANKFIGPADSLISQPIDLTTVTTANRNSVYLSFFWQARGMGEIPDAKDSIRVQFLALDDTVTFWETQWSQSGGLESVSENFTQVILPVNNDRFFHENFRIKFQSFSSQSGPFDTWHIDYIYLNDERALSDLSHRDRTLTGAPSPLFGLYHEVPSEHFFLNPQQYLSPQKAMASNLGPSKSLIYGYKLENLTTGQIYVLQDSLYTASLIGQKEFVEIPTEPFDSIDFGAPVDSLVLVSTFHYKTGDGQPDNVESPLFELGDLLKSNDTIKSYYTLHDHYAYDDGTAEFAAAINVNRGQVAVRYALKHPDTLTHVDIYFPNIAPDATGGTIDIMVWTRLDESGLLTSQTYTITTPVRLNEFKRIRLDRPVLTRDTVYVGYQQYTDNYIGVGFDRNNAAAYDQIFTKTSEAWEQNSILLGALMIRPVFAYDSTFILAARPAIEALQVYPNPSGGYLKIEGDYQSIVIFDLLGKRLYQSDRQPIFDLHFLPEGVYLINVIGAHSVLNEKFIIRRR